MKNLFTYKNNIASGLKRYGKFLLLAISLLFVSNTAWAAAPTQMWMWYCGHASNQWNEANLQSVQMQSLGNNRWSYDINLEVNDYQFFFATSNSKSSILEQNKLDLKDFSPSCATSSTQIEGYNLQGKNNAGRLHVGHSNGDCQITLVVTYKSDSEYIIQVDSPCEETDPSVTTGTGYNNNGKLSVRENKLNELYKDSNCQRYLTRMGIRVSLLNGADRGLYDFNLPNGMDYENYRGKTFDMETDYVITSEGVCYEAFAEYVPKNKLVYGERKCLGELSFALIGTMNGATTSTYADGAKLTKESDNVYSYTVTLTHEQPKLQVIDSDGNIWARESDKQIVSWISDTGNYYATMTKGETTNAAILSAQIAETIKITFTKDADASGKLKFTKIDAPTGTTPVIRIGKQPVVSNLTDVAMNFQIADWGCSTVNTIKVYYTRTDAGIPNNTAPTTSSYVWEFTTDININDNINTTLNKEDLSSGNYNIKAVACNTSGCGELSDMASFSIYCEQPDQPALSATSGTICSGANITLQITNYASELTYKVVKDTEDTDVAIDNDGNFTLTQGGTYVVKVKNDCSDFVSSSNIVITENEKPAAPTFHNSNRASCTVQNVSFRIVKGNNTIITINEGTSVTAASPIDGEVYEGESVDHTIADDLSKIEGLEVDPTKDYTLAFYQYNPTSLCYSAAGTFYIPKNLPVVSVSASNITTTTAVATAEAQPGPVPDTAIAELYVQWRQKETSEWSTSPNIVQNPEYTITYLTEGTTYELQAYAKNNSGCGINGFGYSEIVDFTTATCPKVEQKTVTGENTDGKVQATITMADSDPTCIYQLYIGDTPMADTQQNGTGNDLQWTVNETGTYNVYGWFNPEQVEVPTFCANAPTVMGSYALDCVQAPTPNISIDKNTLCSNDDEGATITVVTASNVTYTLYKDGVLVEGKTLTNNEFTGITEAGSYTVVAKETSCNTTSTSQAVNLTVIDAETTVSITPESATTNPWVPVNFTVTSTAGAPYTLVYKDEANNDVTDQMVVVRRGNNYTLKIPRPNTWNSGNSSNPVASATYTVVAKLQIADDVTCGSGSNLTITLEDTDEICE